jgi:hypothetical protein
VAIIAIAALAHPGSGTSEARIDPNGHGVRTVDAAGGSATQVAVRFTVRPVVILVVNAEGLPKELWSNLGRAPSGEEIAGLRVRIGSLNGREAAATAEVRDAAASALRGADWSVHGRIWKG